MRVLLADDHTLFRAGIASLLEAWGMEIVGQTSDGAEAVVYGEQCLAPELCFTWQRWPVQAGRQK